MSSFILILVFLLLGVIANRAFNIPPQAPQRLNQLVIYVVIPAVILLRVPSLQLNAQLLVLVIASWLAVAISAGLILLFARYFAWSRAITGALLLTAVLGNTSYLGLPMVKLFFGEAALPFAIIYDQIGTFLALAIYGSIILAVYSDNPLGSSVRAVTLRIVKFPPFVTLIIALTLPLQHLPVLVNNVLEGVAMCLVPLTMFIVGLQFQLNIAHADRKPLYVGITCKLLLTPVILLLALYWLSIDQQMKAVAIFESAMPPMVTAGVLAMSANLAPRLSAAMVGFGLLVSLAWLPILHWLTTIVF
jgi:malate permease and related proteins